MGLTYDQLFPGRFIKAGEMHGRAVTLTVRDVYLDVLEQEDGREKQQAIIAWQETDREMALNKTNAQSIMAMFGPDSGDWIGKRITLYPETDSSGLSDSGVCLRVKGSPDITAPITAQIRLPRRKPMTRTLVPTGTGPAATTEAGAELAREKAVQESEALTAQAAAHAAEPDSDLTPEDEQFLAATQRPANRRDDPKATQAQKNMISALIAKSGLAEKEWRSRMEELTGVRSRSDLTREQASRFIDLLTDLAEKADQTS